MTLYLGLEKVTYFVIKEKKKSFNFILHCSLSQILICFGFFTEECASVFHKGGARLILCGKSWEKLEELADDLANASDPSVVSTPALKPDKKKNDGR